MNELVQYALEVVAIPAAIGTAVAAPALVGPLRRRPAVVEGCLASGVALAFVASFAADPGWRAIARQVVAVDGDDGVFERWHRLGLVAAVLVLLAVVLSALRARRGTGRGVWLVFESMLLAAVLAGVFVEFPQPSLAGQIGQGFLVFLVTVSWVFATSATPWIAWIVFGTLAVLCQVSGFAYLAAMCGAVSLASFGIAVLAAIGGRRADAPPIFAAGALLVVPGVLSALIARAGWVYDQAGIPAWTWIAAAMLPLGSLIFNWRALRAERRAARTFWTSLGVALLAVALLAWTAYAQGTKSDGGAGGGDDDLSDMYGGAIVSSPTQTRRT
jgi:hypothetical protein